MATERIWTAALIVIGDEILSGRTEDKNIAQVARWLEVQGIRLREVLTRLRGALDAPVGDNQPYAMEGTDYTVPHHCFAAGRRYVELEIRQDLLATPADTERWARLIERVLG